MKIVTVVGARPQFIKAAAVSRVIRTDQGGGVPSDSCGQAINEVLVHTGQHYDKNMSDVFFSELGIPKPDYNLGVGSGSHANQTAEMLIGIENILIEEKPDYLMVYGDTNSTLAGALAAVKIHIPVIHIEAGLRSYNMQMPEEINRILTDRISEYLFCPTDEAVKILHSEGIKNNVYNVGDVMCDAVRYYGADSKPVKAHLDALIPLFSDKQYPKEWYMATIHRAENTDNKKISNVLFAFERLDAPVIFPVHPRIKGIVKELNDKHGFKNIYFVEPMGYTDMLFFTKNAKKTVTDSGGLQKESYMLGTPCVTVRDQTEWVETLDGNLNVLCSPETDSIVNSVMNTSIDKSKYKEYYGDGHAANRIKAILLGEKI